MRLLIDTHALLWAMEESPALSARANAELAAANRDAFVSIASVWEIAIKSSTGKLRLPDTWLQELLSRLRGSSIALLAVSSAHCGRIATLPLHHRDPFDRMLVAQAQEEGLAIISADVALDAYDVERIW